MKPFSAITHQPGLLFAQSFTSSALHIRAGEGQLDRLLVGGDGRLPGRRDDGFLHAGESGSNSAGKNPEVGFLQLEMRS